MNNFSKKPLFNQIAAKTTITCGSELIEQIQTWPSTNLRQETSLCTIDIIDLYTMIPQIEGVLALRKMLEYLQLKQIGDLQIKNSNGQLITSVYHKPSYEPYYLHMKKNIPFTMLLRTIRYCPTFQYYLDEREKLRMALLLNKYPNHFIEQQFKQLFKKFNIQEPLTLSNYLQIRQDKIINSPIKVKEPIDYGQTLFVHFTYCSNMKSFPSKFHNLWQKYFQESPINDITPILGTRNVNNLQQHLVHTRTT
ncbi:unnamed protein product [Adineta steineri]|uniref:Helix-turn-helix domain-containing protein n=1 Tax=Adineta steineri TaxID=433720 RepID=A0A819KLM0_9BILA|nr:unnamed protein product [Adineta steineri]CAF3951489.1 unnamed protein product [Adineta steineri]